MILASDFVAVVVRVYCNLPFLAASEGERRIVRCSSHLYEGLLMQDVGIGIATATKTGDKERHCLIYIEGGRSGSPEAVMMPR
jgi:hypothetical protein